MISLQLFLVIMIVIVIIILFIIYITRNVKSALIERNVYALGTIITLKVFGKKAVNAIEAAVNRLNEIDDKMSAFKDYSEISRINTNSGMSPQVVSEDTFFLLKSAVKYSKLTNGAFDPTIRPLVNLWDIGDGTSNIPNKEEIDTTLQLVNYKDIVLNKVDSSVFLKNKKQSVDLGGIAKGYAADQVRDIFEKNNIKSATIDLGGNIYALGEKEDGTPWRIGIQNPLSSRGDYIGILSVKNKSVVTSGFYEKFFMKNGKKYHHIIDPLTGYPSESNIISVTIISDNSIEGDGLSTGLYILGLEKASNLLEKIPGVAAIFITDKKEVYITSRVKDFQLTNSEFSSIENIN